MDVRRFRKIHGTIVKELLYEGVMNDSIDPIKSSFHAATRYELLEQARELILFLGLDCILGTIDLWILNDCVISDSPNAQNCDEHEASDCAAEESNSSDASTFLPLSLFQCEKTDATSAEDCASLDQTAQVYPVIDLTIDEETSLTDRLPRTDGRFEEKTPKKTTTPSSCNDAFGPFRPSVSSTPSNDLISIDLCSQDDSEIDLEGIVAVIDRSIMQDEHPHVCVP